MFAIMFVCLQTISLHPSRCHSVVCTYKRQSTVSTPANLRLIDIDKDAWMAQRPSAAVTGDLAFFRPAHGLLVDEVDCCERSWLYRISLMISHWIPDPTPHCSVFSLLPLPKS